MIRNVYSDPVYGRIVSWSTSHKRSLWFCLEDDTLIAAEKRQGDNKVCGLLSFDSTGELTSLFGDDNRQLIFEGIANNYEEIVNPREMYYHET